MQIKEIIKIRKKGDNSSFKYKNALQNEKGVLFGGVMSQNQVQVDISVGATTCAKLHAGQWVLEKCSALIWQASFYPFAVCTKETSA